MRRHNRLINEVTPVRVFDFDYHQVGIEILAGGNPRHHGRLIYGLCTPDTLARHVAFRRVKRQRVARPHADQHTARIPVAPHDDAGESARHLRAPDQRIDPDTCLELGQCRLLFTCSILEDLTPIGRSAVIAFS